MPACSTRVVRPHRIQVHEGQVDRVGAVLTGGDPGHQRRHLLGNARAQGRSSGRGCATARRCGGSAVRRASQVPLQQRPAQRRHRFADGDQTETSLMVLTARISTALSGSPDCAACPSVRLTVPCCLTQISTRSETDASAKYPHERGAAVKGGGGRGGAARLSAELAGESPAGASPSVAP